MGRRRMHLCGATIAVVVEALDFADIRLDRERRAHAAAVAAVVAVLPTQPNCRCELRAGVVLDPALSHGQAHPDAGCCTILSIVG